MRISLSLLIAFVALLVASLAPPRAEAARALDGRCGLHIGSLVVGTDHVWHMRLGVRRGHVGGPMHCRGLVRVRSSGRGQTAGLVWRQYGRGRRFQTFRW